MNCVRHGKLLPMPSIRSILLSFPRQIALSIHHIHHQPQRKLGKKCLTYSLIWILSYLQVGNHIFSLKPGFPKHESGLMLIVSQTKILLSFMNTMPAIKSHSGDQRVRYQTTLLSNGYVPSKYSSYFVFISR